MLNNGLYGYYYGFRAMILPTFGAQVLGFALNPAPQGDFSESGFRSSGFRVAKVPLVEQEECRAAVVPYG